MINSHKKHYPAEIFGYPIENISKDAQDYRIKYLCPFTDEQCSKLSRLINYPMGICSVWWPDNNPIAICPEHFLQNNTLFVSIAENVFGNIDNILLFKEVKLKEIGVFDFVLVKHKPISNIIEDFCVIKFQTCSTTATGKLVKAIEDYMSGLDIMEHPYGFGMNTYNDIKLSFIQMLNKGQIFEMWSKKIVWAVQRYLYDNMVKRFGLKNMEFDEKDANRFLICNIDCSFPEQYHIISENIYSSNIENLIRAFKRSKLPKLDDFINVLSRKLKLNLGISIYQ